MVGLYQVGIDVSGPLYWTLVGALSLTALTIWAECSHAFTPPARARRPRTGRRRRRPPSSRRTCPTRPTPSWRRSSTSSHHDYNGDLQVVLAYNTPVPLPVEERLAALDARSRAAHRAQGRRPTSKAQNVNAALRVATGEFVGIFDADHHPADGSFDRAWRWIAAGHDVVQGHCVIRNGEDSALASSSPSSSSRSTPWRTRAAPLPRLRDLRRLQRLLARHRPRADPAARVLPHRGHRGLDARPSAPAAAWSATRAGELRARPRERRSLWKQRLRWAQGWFQVSVRHLWPLLRAPAPVAAPEGRTRLPARLAGGLPVDLDVRLAAARFLVWRDGGLRDDLTAVRPDHAVRDRVRAAADAGGLPARPPPRSAGTRRGSSRRASSTCSSTPRPRTS